MCDRLTCLLLINAFNTFRTNFTRVKFVGVGGNIWNTRTVALLGHSDHYPTSTCWQQTNEQTVHITNMIDVSKQKDVCVPNNVRFIEYTLPAIN